MTRAFRRNLMLLSQQSEPIGRVGTAARNGLTVPHFSEATDLFRFRTIPSLTVTADMRLICGGSVFEITSVEDVKGRGMYIEALAKEVQPSG